MFATRDDTDDPSTRVYSSLHGRRWCGIARGNLEQHAQQHEAAVVSKRIKASPSVLLFASSHPRLDQAGKRGVFQKSVSDLSPDEGVGPAHLVWDAHRIHTLPIAHGLLFDSLLPARASVQYISRHTMIAHNHHLYFARHMNRYFLGHSIRVCRLYMLRRDGP
jgi:hypothetical protein